MTPDDFKTQVMHITENAQGERGCQDAIRSLREADQMCIRWCDIDKTETPLMYRGQVLSEVAMETYHSTERAKLWRQSVQLLTQAVKKNPHSIHAVSSLCATATDCFQDTLSDLTFPAKLQFLRSARDYADKFVKGAGDMHEVGTILARKSSLLRHLALAELTPDAKLRRIEESNRCANLAVAKLVAPHTILESAMSEWALARYEKSDESYAQRLRKAEELFLSSELTGSITGQLALSRFYRLTFQALKACKSYPREGVTTSSRRRVMRDAYILAESAIQLWYAKYPEECVHLYASEGRSLLEMANSAGYRTARCYIALAYLTAILDGPDQSNAILKELRGNSDLTWNEVADLAASATPTSVVDYGLAVGINQSAVWTRLGTYAALFLRDDDLARQFYDTAVRIDPHDSIALTNLARHMFEHDSLDRRDEARRLLQKAQSFADRRFTWWRTVLAEINGRDSILPSSSSLPPRMDYGIPNERKKLRKEFRKITMVPEPQQRGYQLERIFYDLAKLTFGIANPSYRMERCGGSISQIDGSFYHNTNGYRIECKWQRNPATPSDIVLFCDKLDVANIGGLFISMAGFSSEAFARARELSHDKVILLMDGSEVEDIFEMKLNLDEVVQIKRQHYDFRSNPYHRVASSVCS